MVISGHHRLEAAKRAGLPEVPCFVREMDDETAYMQLVLCNTQSELHPLEEGKHAAESGMSLREYASKSGKSKSDTDRKISAARVYVACPHVGTSAAIENWRNLAEIHAASRWLWSALVDQMLEDSWTVEKTRAAVAYFKDIETPPDWVDADKLAGSNAGFFAG